MTTDTGKRPSKAEIEAHFNDDAGATPLPQDFDAAPGALCGNGQSLYRLARPRKPAPPGWRPPPPPGSDPAYQGPLPGAPFKESPYAVPGPRVVLARPPIVDDGEPAFAAALRRVLGETMSGVAVPPGRDVAEPFPFAAGRLFPFAEDMLNGDDEAAAARALLDDGIGFVLIDRTTPPVSPWVEERMSSLWLRLRDAGDLSWFHPRVLGSGWAVYRIAPPLRLEEADRRAITERVRALLAGATPPALSLQAPLEPVGQPVHRVIVSLRMRDEPLLKGRKLVRRMARDVSLVGAVDAAARRLRRSWAETVRRTAKEFGLSLPPGPERLLDRLQVEIDVLTDVCQLTDRTPSRLGWYLEVGLDGLYLWDEEKNSGGYLEPSHGVHMGLGSAMVFLETALRKNGHTELLRPAKNPQVRRRRPVVLYEGAWQRDQRLTVMRFRTLHWIERPAGGGIVSLYRGVPLCREVSRDLLVRSLQLGADWLMNNQMADGQYRYKYTPTNKAERRWAPGGNIVRHALNPYTLLMVNAIAPDPRLVASACRGIDFTLRFLRWQGERCIICHRDPPAAFHNAKLGSNAVTILSILKLAEVQDIGPYAAALRGLAEELLHLQDANGHFWQYDVPPEHPYYGAENTIAPGEFILALARMYKHTRDERYLDSAVRGLDWHLKAWRIWRDERTLEGIYDEEHRVNLVGIVPWLVMAMKELFDTTGAVGYADIAFELQDWLDQEFFYYPRRSRYPDWLGGSFKFHGEAPAINSCQYIEGASAAYAIARQLGNDLDRRRQIVLLGVRFCLQLQFDGYDSTFFLPVPEEALGGYRYTLTHLHLRNDYSYHAMAALAQSVAYLDADDFRRVAPAASKEVRE